MKIQKTLPMAQIFFPILFLLILVVLASCDTETEPVHKCRLGIENQTDRNMMLRFYEEGSEHIPDFENYDEEFLEERTLLSADRDYQMDIRLISEGIIIAEDSFIFKAEAGFYDIVLYYRDGQIEHEEKRIVPPYIFLINT